MLSRLIQRSRSRCYLFIALKHIHKIMTPTCHANMVEDSQTQSDSGHSVDRDCDANADCAHLHFDISLCGRRHRQDSKQCAVIMPLLKITWIILVWLSLSWPWPSGRDQVCHSGVTPPSPESHSKRLSHSTSTLKWQARLLGYIFYASKIWVSSQMALSDRNSTQQERQNVRLELGLRKLSVETIQPAYADTHPAHYM